MTHESVRDAGLQRERTVLAWHRTIAALFASSLVLLRLLPDSIGLTGTVLASGGLVAAVTCAALAHRRVRRIVAEPWPADRLGPAHRMPGGALLGIASLLVTADAVGALAVAFVRFRF